MSNEEVDEQLAEGKKKQSKKSQSIAQMSKYDKIPFNNEALRVGVPVGRKDATFHALIEPENGLCKGIQVPCEAVY